MGGSLVGPKFAVSIGSLQVETVQASGLSAGSREVTIVRGPDQSQAFTDWIEQSVGNDAGSREALLITELNSRMEPVRRVRLPHAYPSSWTGETVTVQCDGAIVE
ncbi:phage tail protein [Streptomyces sp. NBC_00320]|uniref:phage tail protein n=1 Tax=Streptomyces sp. NBC_00320 TaxID=2975711 RepID=UPI00338E735D